MFLLSVCYHLMIQNNAKSAFSIYIVDLAEDLQHMPLFLSISILLIKNDSFNLTCEVTQMSRLITFSVNLHTLVSITLRCNWFTTTVYEYHTVHAPKQCFFRKPLAFCDPFFYETEKSSIYIYL